MFGQLAPKGVRVPNGFATTAEAYRDMLSQAGAWERLHALLDDLDKSDVAELARELGLQSRPG
jgi:pyruvate,water dikinase